MSKPIIVDGEAFSYLAIERPNGATYSRDEGYVVYGYGTYEKGSVLAGRHKRVWLEAFDTIEEAKAAFPQAEVAEGSGYIPIEMPHTPPADFDPGYAGESWDED